MLDAREALLTADLVRPRTDADALASVAVRDQGLRPFVRRGVLVDHHAPETDDPGEGVVFVSGFGEDPEMPTAPLVRRLLGDDTGRAGSFLAAVGAAGDRGRPGLDLPECASAAKTATLKLVPFINAPRRMAGAGGAVLTALELLVEHDCAKAAHGHPQATGGGLPPDEFERMPAAL